MKKLSTKKLIFITLGLLSVSLILGIALFTIDDVGAEHMDGTYIEAGSSELFEAVIVGLIISIPLVCLILGAITSIFIERDTPYLKRYIRGYFFTASGIYLIFSIMGAVRIITLMVF